MKNFLWIVIIFLMNSQGLLNAQTTDTISAPDYGEDKFSSSWNIYPNPSNGTFQIVYTSATNTLPYGWGGKLIVAITDPNGEVVYIETISDLEEYYNRTIDLSSKPKGLYTVEIVSGSKKAIKRIILN